MSTTDNMRSLKENCSRCASVTNRELRALLTRMVKYVREDRAVTPRKTRLARLTDEVVVYLKRTHDPFDILRGQECDIEGCDAPGCREDWDDTTDVDLRVQHIVGPYPTLHAIGLGPQLAELERICADAAKGKHSGENILQWGDGYHWNKAISHLNRGEFGKHDNDSGARHIIHAAARLLMAAACFDAAVKDCLTAADCLDAEER